MLDPLIGITDFTMFHQVGVMLQTFRKHSKPGSRRRLHVGAMMSYKTLNGIPSRFHNAFPAKEDIAKIFYSEAAYNCLHYVDYDGSQNLWKDLLRVISYGGVGIHALQLDMIWPDPADVAKAVYASRKKIEVILQIGKNAFEHVNNDPKSLVSVLVDYVENGVVHRVLLDKSMGRGICMHPTELLPYMRAIRDEFPSLGLIVAGGLGPDNLYLLEPIIKEFPDVSIDAQSRLRPSRNALDPIDWSMANDYLIRALELLN